MGDKIKALLGRIAFSIIIPLITFIYVYLNEYRPGMHEIKTYIDQLIPFISIFSIPYIFMFPYFAICMLYFAIYDYKIYFKLLISDVVGMMICYCFFYLYPTTVPRPILNEHGFLGMLMHYIYSENPYNCFPSIHVLSSFLPIFFAFKYGKSRFMKLFTLLGGVLISISTLFVKQHYILDAVSAILLAIILYLVFTNEYLWNKTTLKKTTNFIIPSFVKKPFINN